MDTQKESLRKEMIRLRQEKGWSQRDVGTITKIPWVAIADMEEGVISPAIEVYERIIDKLHGNYRIVKSERPSVMLRVSKNKEITLPRKILKKLSINKQNRVIELNDFDKKVLIQDSYGYRIDKGRKTIAKELKAAGRL